MARRRPENRPRSTGPGPGLGRCNHVQHTSRPRRAGGGSTPPSSALCGPPPGNRPSPGAGRGPAGGRFGPALIVRPGLRLLTLRFVIRCAIASSVRARGGAGYKHASFQYDQCHAEGRGNGRQGTAAPWPQWAYSFLPGPVPGRGRGRGLEPGSLAPSGG